MAKATAEKQNDGRHERTDVFLETNHDRGASRTVVHGDQSLVIYHGHFLVIGFILSNARDILGRAVAEVGDHPELLDRICTSEAFLRFDGDFLYGRIVLRTVAEALANPPDEGPVVITVPAEAGSSLMGEFPTALEKQQAMMG